MKSNTLTIKRLTLSGVMLALSVVLAVVCGVIPFLNLPFGGGFTIASMLPIIVISYMYGTKWGFFVSFTYAVIQMIMDIFMGKSSTIMALFMPSSDSYMGIGAGIAICFLDYIAAYSVLCVGGAFRRRIKSKRAALCIGSIFALSLRYLFHILSGCIFYGAWAEWFFSQEGFVLGEKILESVSGGALTILYSVVYNGLYMIPEIIITAVAAILISGISQIKSDFV